MFQNITLPLRKRISLDRKEIGQRSINKIGSCLIKLSVQDQGIPAISDQEVLYL